jgi:hypothetical protein
MSILITEIQAAFIQKTQKSDSFSNELSLSKTRTFKTEILNDIL